MKNKIITVLITTVSLTAAASSLTAQYSLVAGWDFNNTDPLADPAAYQADVAGSATVFLDTTAFQQPSTPGGGGTAIDFNAQYVGFGDIGNTPTIGDFDASNGFSSDPFDIYFQGQINNVAWTINSLDVSGFESIQFQFDSFSNNTGIIPSGILSYQLDSGASSTAWDSGNANVTFGGSYAASDTYILDVSGASTLDIAFTFNSSETALGNLTNRAYFDNIAIGGAVPEPSTYAAIAGALALGFAVYRRRK